MQQYQIRRNGRRLMKKQINIQNFQKNNHHSQLFFKVFLQLKLINLEKELYQEYKQRRLIVTYIEIYWIIQSKNLEKMQKINLFQLQKQCEKVLIEEPQHLHALYRKSFWLSYLNEHQQAIQCIDKALNYNSNYCVGYFNKGYSLGFLGKYNKEIVCYDKAIKLDPNFAQAYNNKEIINLKINDLKKYNEAIVCYDKAIQLNPNYAQAYKNKGALLDQLKKYQQAIENYKQALLYCKQDQKKFKQLIIEVRNKK
ncbi:unnamed protein product [Paramecium pentaurelia]|nr:unnamed protein product [Paramecium pentaurelia]